MLAKVARAFYKLVMYPGQIGKCDVSELRNQVADAFLIRNQLGISGLSFSFDLGDDQ